MKCKISAARAWFEVQEKAVSSQQIAVFQSSSISEIHSTLQHLSASQ